MTLEERIDKLTAALEQLTIALVKIPAEPKAAKAAKAAAPAAAETPKPEAAKGPTADDIRGIAMQMLDLDAVNKNDVGLKFLTAIKTEFGVRAAAVPADKVAEVHARVAKKLEEMQTI
jgi:DNA replication initiation complex subunit (GINS family)